MNTARTYRTEAITLRASPFAERDRLLVLYTRHHGKLRAVALGVRRTTSRLARNVDLFTHANLFLVHGRNLDRVTDGQTLGYVPLLHEDLWRLAQAFYCAELVDRFTEECIPNPGLFEALLRVLQQIGDAGLEPTICVRAFELAMLGLVGYQPQLHRCVACGTAIEPVANFFSPADGGVLCPVCGPKAPAAAAISVEALRILRNLQTRPEEIVGRVRVGKDTLDQAEGLLMRYIQYLLDVRVRSVGFIEVLRRLQTTQQERSVALG